MARETGEELNRAVVEGDRDGLGLGAAVGRHLAERRPRPRHLDHSLLAAAWRLGLPATVHVALGTDIVHMHPACDPAAVGRASHLDFRLLAAQVARPRGRRGLPQRGLRGGAARGLPEGRDPGPQPRHPIDDFATANLDFIQSYRPGVERGRAPGAGARAGVPADRPPRAAGPAPRGARSWRAWTSEGEGGERRAADRQGRHRGPPGAEPAEVDRRPAPRAGGSPDRHHRGAGPPGLRLGLQPRPPAGSPPAPPGCRSPCGRTRTPGNALAPGKRFGTVLVEAGILQPKQLVKAVIDQTRSIILHAFEWGDGDVRARRGGGPGRVHHPEHLHPPADPRGHLPHRVLEPHREGLRGARVELGRRRTPRPSSAGCPCPPSRWPSWAPSRASAISRRCARESPLSRLRGLPDDVGLPRHRPGPAARRRRAPRRRRPRVRHARGGRRGRLMEAGSEASLAGRTCVVTGASAGIGRADVAGAGPPGRPGGDGGPQPGEGREGAPGDRERHGQRRGRARARGPRPAGVDPRLRPGPRRAPPHPRRAGEQRRHLVGDGAGGARRASSSSGPPTCSATSSPPSLLLPRLRASGRARVVNVASRLAGGLDLDDLEFERRPYTGRDAYAQSKQANRMLTWALARRLEGTGVTANAVHPGFVSTEIFAKGGGLVGLGALALGEAARAHARRGRRHRGLARRRSRGRGPERPLLGGPAGAPLPLPGRGRRGGPLAPLREHDPA